VDVVIEQASSG
jgi:hypothetical protein